MTFVLEILYDRNTKLYQAVTLNRVQDRVTTEVGRWCLGDPQLDWYLIKLTATYMKRQEARVLMGNSCQRFVTEVPGWVFNEDGQLVRV